MNEHWVLCIVDVRRLAVVQYDSLKRSSGKQARFVRKWFVERVVAQGYGVGTEAELGIITPSNLPKQQNTSDCGAFICKYADLVVQEKPIKFTQEHMPYIRARMAYEIIVGHVA